MPHDNHVDAMPHDNHVDVMPHDNHVDIMPHDNHVDISHMTTMWMLCLMTTITGILLHADNVDIN